MTDFFSTFFYGLAPLGIVVFHEEQEQEIQTAWQQFKTEIVSSFSTDITNMPPDGTEDDALFAPRPSAELKVRAHVAKLDSEQFARTETKNQRDSLKKLIEFDGIVDCLRPIKIPRHKLSHQIIWFISHNDLDAVEVHRIVDRVKLALHVHPLNENGYALIQYEQDEVLTDALDLLCELPDLKPIKLIRSFTL